MNESAGTITSSPGPAAASAMWSAEVPLFVARQKRGRPPRGRCRSRSASAEDSSPERILEEARQMRHRAGLALPLDELGEPHQIQHERCGEDRVAPLPVTKRELPLR